MARREDEPAVPINSAGQDGKRTRRMVAELGGGDASKIKAVGARFTSPVFPGETLRVTAWKGDDGYVGNVTVPARDNAVALGDVEFRAV